MTLKQDIIHLYEENPNITAKDIAKQLGKKEDGKFWKSLVNAQFALRRNRKDRRDTRSQKFLADVQYEEK